MGEREASGCGLFVIRDDGALVGVARAAYDSEALLQRLLAQYPALMAGDQIDSGSPRRFLLISREIGVPDEVGASNRWSLDHLFVDQDAIPTLVEVKTADDNRIRREVVGQMLDYAANAVVHWPIETVRAAFERRCDRESRNADAEIAGFLSDDRDPEEFWAAVKTNLQAGKIRLLFVVDRIPTELRRIVEFLNEQMDPAEVLALEVRQYAGEGLKMLMPRVYGQTAQAEQKKGAGRGGPARLWDEASFFGKLAERGDEREMRVARVLFDWAGPRRARIEFGTGVKMASFHPIVDGDDGAWFRPFGAYTGYATGAAYAEIPLDGSGMKAPPFDSDDAKAELVRRINAIDGVHIAADLRKRPSVRLVALSEADRIDRFLAVMDWAVEQVRTAQRDTGRHDGR